MREQQVVVAVVKFGIDEFLVTYNDHWVGYAFPMQAVDGDEATHASAAIEALQTDLGLRLPHATAEELDFLGCCGVSGRTGETTSYHYWVFAVDPGVKLDPDALPGRKDYPPLAVRYKDLGTRDDITWSTSELVQHFVESQEVVLSVITRPGERETEFLVVQNDNYGGYFFPAQRVKSEFKPEQWAAGTVYRDLGYRGSTAVEWRGEVSDVHFSNRYFRDRLFRFHICEVRLPECDVYQPYNLLERGLMKRKRKFRWLSASDLSDFLRWQPPETDPPAAPPAGPLPTGTPHDPRFSPTMFAVWPIVLGTFPRQIHGPLRQSEGGIALIERSIDGRREWLCQFNDGWKAFFLVGGHREPPESYRDCVVREIEEELGLTAAECPVAVAAAHRLHYKAQSRRAGKLTDYTMELFEAQPTSTGLEKIAANRINRFLTEAEILRLGANDGRDVSETVLSVLAQTGRISP